MPAYVVALVQITDPDGFAEYATQVPALVAAHGGVYRARGGHTELLEGSAPSQRVVVIEFPDRDAAEGWYHSEAYEQVRQIRTRCAESIFLITDGITAAPHS